LKNVVRIGDGPVCVSAEAPSSSSTAADLPTKAAGFGHGVETPDEPIEIKVEADEEDMEVIDLEMNKDKGEPSTFTPVEDMNITMNPGSRRTVTPHLG
jgi:hypothetical protein